MSVEMWILLGVNSLLMAITSFFIKTWINDIRENYENSKRDLNNYKGDVSKDLRNINNELGKRKGETELLRKDLEILSSETRKSFENVNIHMVYQKATLEEIKSAVMRSTDKELDILNKLIISLKEEKSCR